MVGVKVQGERRVRGSLWAVRLVHSGRKRGGGGGRRWTSKAVTEGTAWRGARRRPCGKEEQ